MKQVEKMCENEVDELEEDDYITTELVAEGRDEYKI